MLRLSERVSLALTQLLIITENNVFSEMRNRVGLMLDQQ